MNRSLSISWMLFISMATAPALAVSFHPLGNPPGALESHGYAVSADGSTVVGLAQMGGDHNEAFRYQAGQIVTLGILPGPSYSSEATGVSGEGAIIVGYSGLSGGGAATVWQNGIVAGLSGGTGSSRARAISADGAVIVGEAGGWPSRWVNGILYPLSASVLGRAHAVSADGSVIVGGVGLHPEAFRWENGTMTGLGYLPGGYGFSTAYGVSADGSVVVGHSISGRGREAFRWEDGVMTGLGFLPDGASSDARAVSGDGSVIVGHASTSLGQEAFIWDTTYGMRNLRRVLIESGLDMTGWRLFDANGISADGLTMVGTAQGPDGVIQPYMAVIPEPATLGLLAIGGLVLLRRQR